MSQGLVAKGLVYRYPGESRAAVEGVGLSLEPGRRIAVVGANGSGKSTLLLLLKGLLLPDEGTVSIDGRAPRDGEPPAHLEVGMIFQDPEDQIVATRVDEDVAFGPENLDIGGAALATRVAEALAAVGMEGMAEREPHTLSGGEKQRLAIAGALALRPRYLLLDEATSMLDLEGRNQVRSVIDRLAASGRVGILEVTHDLTEALGADDVIVIERGHLAAAGEPRRILSDVDLLIGVGLAPLRATRLAKALREAGFAVPATAMTADEVVAAL